MMYPIMGGQQRGRGMSLPDLLTLLRMPTDLRALGSYFGGGAGAGAAAGAGPTAASAMGGVGIGGAELSGLGGSGAGAGGLGAITPWLGPIGIGLGILGTAGEWSGGGLGFGRSKDATRRAMSEMGPEAAGQSILDQLGGTPIWRSQSDATSPLGLLDSWGDVYDQSRRSPAYKSLEDAIFRAHVGPSATEIDETGLQSLMGDAASAGVLANRGIHLDPWRSHPYADQRYAWRPMTAFEELWQRNRFQEEGGNR